MAGPEQTSGENRARGWSQTFRDAALEDAYQRGPGSASRIPYRWLSAVTLVVWLLSFPVDASAAGSPANLDMLSLIRYACASPAAAALAAFGWVSIPTFRRWKNVAFAGLVVVYVVSPMVMSLLVPEPELFDARSLSGAVLAGLVFISCMWALWGARFDVLSLFVLPLILLFGALVLRRFPDPNAGKQLWGLASAVLAASMAAWLIDRTKRDAFLSARDVERERERSDALLNNMLPEAIATRLKIDSTRIAEHFDEATVLFGDLAGFTPLSEELSASELVETLDQIFSAFDEIANRLGLEKIKTIGDAYMVVGGIPARRADHAEAVATMALEMRDVIAQRRFAGGRKLEIRIGIHTGPVVAGVIGRKKFVYDLWGDTVNTASRMESHGEPGKVQVTEAVWTRLHERFALTARGTIQVKGKGEMRTWFLEGR